MWNRSENERVPRGATAHFKKEVAKLARNIEEAFRLGEKVAILKVVNKNNGTVELEVRYTPVRRSLRKKAEKLGNYMHSAKKHHEHEHVFWHKFKVELEEAINELEWSTSGRLLGPLLKHKNKRDIKVMIERPTKKEFELIKQYTKGREVILVIEYE